MLTFRPIPDGEGYASRHLSANDYFSEKERVIGHWMGKGAEKLGIEWRPVTNEAFEAIRQGFHPDTGEQLRRTSAVRYDKEGNVIGEPCNLYDWVASCPKSISCKGVIGGHRAIYAAHDIAVNEAWEELQKLAQARVRIDGANTDRDTHNLVMAVYPHDSSRELDPQIHTHVVIANLTYDPVEEK